MVNSIIKLIDLSILDKQMWYIYWVAYLQSATHHEGRLKLKKVTWIDINADTAKVLLSSLDIFKSIIDLYY